jgi:arylsulfatase A-like enzyme
MARWFKRGFDYYGHQRKRNLFENIFYHLIVLPYLLVKYMVSNIGLLRIYSKKRKFRAKSLWRGFTTVMKTFLFTFDLVKIQDAKLVTRLAQKLIKENKKDKFFLFLHYWDTHSPYYCPKRYKRGRKSGLSPKEKLLLRYRGAVRYVDEQIGRLIEILKKEDIHNNTLVIITSDHGESLTEHDIFFDHHGLYDQTTHVPLILYCPDLFSEPKRIDGLVQHVDLAPTLCEILNIDDRQFDFDGESLESLWLGKKTDIRSYAFSEESYVQRKICLRTKKLKYIFAPDKKGMCNYCLEVHGGSEEYYDLDADPQESKNLIKVDKHVAAGVKEELFHLLKRLDEKRKRHLARGTGKDYPHENQLDPGEEKSVKRKLRSLGYMD